MKKLILILLAFIALFTYIRASEKTEASATPTAAQAVITVEVTREIPVEIVR